MRGSIIDYLEYFILSFCRESMSVASSITAHIFGKPMQDLVVGWQVRISDARRPSPIISKGVLVPCKALPPGTIIVPFSMVKAPADMKVRRSCCTSACHHHDMTLAQSIHAALQLLQETDAIAQEHLVL
jgi:hypothetical protein